MQLPDGLRRVGRLPPRLLHASLQRRPPVRTASQHQSRGPGKCMGLRHRQVAHPIALGTTNYFPTRPIHWLLCVLQNAEICSTLSHLYPDPSLSVLLTPLPRTYNTQAEFRSHEWSRMVSQMALQGRPAPRPDDPTRSALGMCLTHIRTPPPASPPPDHKPAHMLTICRLRPPWEEPLAHKHLPPLHPPVLPRWCMF